MLSKQLLFRLAIILFIVTVIGLVVFKVSQLSIDVTKASIQSRMEPVFFLEGKTDDTNIKYQIVDPVVTVLDSGDIAMKANITLSSGLDKKWGSMNFVTKVALLKKDNSFYLEVTKPVQLKFSGLTSDETGFSVWNKPVESLIEMISKQMNVFLFNKDIYALSGSELRVQAVSLVIHEVDKTSDGIQVVLDVDQGIFVIIVYFAMFLSAFIFACGYFFVGGAVGFKDPTKMLFIDPKKIPKKQVK